MKFHKLHNIRALAALTITETLQENAPLSQILQKYKTFCKKEEDRSLLQAICYGVMRFYPRLEFFAAKLLKKPFKDNDKDIYHLILVGLYQLEWMRIPPHAALSETVEGARLLKKPWAVGLVNAILRSYQRNAETFQKEIDAADPAILFHEIAENENEDYLLAAKTAHPIWLLQKIKHAWPEDWEKIIAANNSPPPLILRVNLRQISRQDYLDNLKNVRIEASPIDKTAAGIKIAVPCDVVKLPGFNEGFFSVQDAASQQVAGFLQLEPGLRVLDACSAPGGKLSHILETESELKEVVAIDSAEDKIKIIQENLSRLRLWPPKSESTPAPTVTIQCADASKPTDWWDGVLFDRILCDAPCSATGVIRRHPDIKMQRKPQDITRLASVQLALLKTLWTLLKPGGILLYTTCSILNEENQEVIDKFCKSLPPQSFKLELNLSIMTGQNDMDGFYYASIRKI